MRRSKSVTDIDIGSFDSIASRMSLRSINPLTPRSPYRAYSTTPWNSMHTDFLSPAHLSALESLGPQMRSAPEFPHFCVDDFLETEFAKQVHDSFPTYQEAGRLGDSLNAVNERKKIQITDAALFPEPIRGLHEAVASDEFVATLSRISGIEGLLADPALAGVASTRPTRVAASMSTSTSAPTRPSVSAAGSTCWSISTRTGTSCSATYSICGMPMSSTASAASQSSSTGWPAHLFAGCHAQVVAAYYYSKDAPPDGNGVKHSTLFRPRPQEFWRG